MAVPGCRTDFGDFFKTHERLFGPAIRHTVSRNVSFAVRPFLNDEPPRLHRGSRGGIRKTHVTATLEFDIAFFERFGGLKDVEREFFIDLFEFQYQCRVTNALR